MGTKMTRPEALFALNMIAPVLDGFAFPEGPFSPRGDWTLSYQVYTHSMRLGKAGWLGLTRKAQESGGQLRVSYIKGGAGGSRQLVDATLICDEDGLSTPRKWAYRSEIRDKDNNTVPNTRVEKSARRAGDAVIISDGRTAREMPVQGAFSVNWALFDAVQRLPREAFAPMEFILLDHFDQPKPGQVLSYRGAFEVHLGWKRVQREEMQQLTKGRVYKTRWKREGGRAVRLHAYDLLGPGNVPWVYWLDEAGRPLFVVAGLESYILQGGEAGGQGGAS